MAASIHFERLSSPTQTAWPRDATELAWRGNRRRLRVFLAVFVLVLVGGLVVVFSRPPEFLASARIEISPPKHIGGMMSASAQVTAATLPSAPVTDDVGTSSAVTETITSRALVDQALAVLKGKGIELREYGPDPARGIQDNLDVVGSGGRNVLKLSLHGTQPAHLSAFLNALVEAYVGQLAQQYNSDSSVENQTLREELNNLEAQLAAKRKGIEDYRQRHDIVSGDSMDNQVITRARGLADSLNGANDAVAKAEAKLQSLRDSIANGRAVVRSRDNPTLAGMETRASQLRETLREQERIYTPEFMARDPLIRGMQSRLADLERQILEQRKNSAEAALSEAEEELSSARQTQSRLRHQSSEERGLVHAFSRNFSTYKAMGDELSQLEASRRNVAEQLLRTESSERSRRPSVRVIEAAEVPSAVWRPNYMTDTAITIGAAFLAGILAMGFVELFNRAPRQPETSVVVPQQWLAVEGARNLALRQSTPDAELTSPHSGLALAAPIVRRELSADETHQLLKAASAGDILLIALLLSGATLDEIRSMKASDIDIERERVHIVGNPDRDIHFPRQLMMFVPRSTRPDEPVLTDAGGTALSDDEARRRVICAAHDAALDDPAGISPETLRHTCIAHLVRLGLRFGELSNIVGVLQAEALSEYSGMAPREVRYTVAEIDPVLPALKGFFATSDKAHAK